MNLKEAAKGNPARHLYNCIKYIMNEDKTINGALVGGNVGIATPEESYKYFIDTKMEYDKLTGRQGYHFVVSFAPSEVGYEEAFQMIEEWTQQYLGDQYDYVFAVHNDHDHIHGHIVFNSVRRTDGYKYHYVKGDWEKDIQPITDKICLDHGLQPLSFKERGKGQSYADWMSRKNVGFSEKDIYRADIDYVIDKVSSYEEFKKALLQMGYTIQREGYSRKSKQEYLTLKAPGLPRGRRTDKLGPSYSLAEIKGRIITKEGPHMDRNLTDIMKRQFQPISLQANAFTKSSFLYSRSYHATGFYEIRTLPQKADWIIRKDILSLNNYIDALNFMNVAGFQSYDEVKSRADKAQHDYTALRSERYSLIHLRSGLNEDELQISNRYYQLRSFEKQEENAWSDHWEDAANEIEHIEQQYDYNIYSLTDRIEFLNEQIRLLKAQKKYTNIILDGYTPSDDERELQEPQIGL